MGVLVCSHVKLELKLREINYQCISLSEIPYMFTKFNVFLSIFDKGNNKGVHT